ncbi:tRNA glutamyl-Q(34) synthetase GluQRS [Hyphomonas sp.]|uniref:tRNA glutamyl-Q(34) synthetase GluQRS n=1 Tax=Hyphomonas sp. TaxID=87 RepID=UPI00391CB0CF
MPEYLTRFAPSPTGRLHLGHALSAASVWDAAGKAGGRVLLRIEDIDQTRCRPEYETAILEDLAWLGHRWHGPVRRQSEHFADYAAVLAQLEARGLIYRCFRTRRELVACLPAGADPAEGGFTGRPLKPAEEAERLSRGAPFAWRLSLAAAREALGPRYCALTYLEERNGRLAAVRADPAPFGDVVLARKDTPASYHLACCHDDALQGVTHVVRGEDLRVVTAIHALLQALMGWPAPVYSFHPLLMGPDGKKLSKSHAAKSLAEYRGAGMTAGDIRAMTAPA